MTASATTSVQSSSPISSIGRSPKRATARRQYERYVSAVLPSPRARSTTPLYSATVGAPEGERGLVPGRSYQVLDREV